MSMALWRRHWCWRRCEDQSDRSTVSFVPKGLLSGCFVACWANAGTRRRRCCFGSRSGEEDSRRGKTHLVTRKTSCDNRKRHISRVKVRGRSDLCFQFQLVTVQSWLARAAQFRLKKTAS